MHRSSFELARPDGLVVRGDALIPDAAATSVLLCHGFKGFGRWAFFPLLAERIAATGLGAVSFDFSGSGVGADRESFTEAEAFASNTFTRELDDLAAVEAEARRRGWLGERTGMFGFSRGGGIAVLRAAIDARVGALVTWSSIATIVRWPPEARRAWHERGFTEITNARTGQVLRLGTALLAEVEAHAETALDIAAAASRVRAPWLIVHGTEDETVPFAEGERLRDASGGRAEFIAVPGANHPYHARHPLDDVSPRLERAIAETTAFFAAHLLGRT